MRRILSYLLVLLLTVSAIGVQSFTMRTHAQGLDSLKRQTLSLKLEEYFMALRNEPLPVQEQECDFLIESSSDSLVRQFVAETIFNHFADSKVMGAENVAVHVFDKWFLSGLVKMQNNNDFVTAKVFADFNRESLLGRNAPAFAMEDISGGMVELFDEADKGGAFRILYFYDTSCAKCRMETILLRNLLSVKGYPVEFYAIYAGDDRQSWMTYASEAFNLASAAVKVEHMWDPELKSDFQRLYGVVQTPRMFLIGPDGIILGRGLDTKALEQLLDGIFAKPKELEYGGEEAMRMFDSVFHGRDVTAGIVQGVSDYVAHKTLEQGDTLMFRQLAGDLLYYLSLRQGEAFKEGMDYHIDSYILSRNDIWKTSDDSLKVVGFAGIMDDLLSKTVPGSRVPSLKVKAEMLSSKGVKSGQYNLRKVGAKKNYILFYTEGCEVCAAEKESARKLVEGDRNVRVLMVNVDRIMQEDPALASRLLDTFDLSSLPYIIETDSKGYVIRRYLSLLSDE